MLSNWEKQKLKERYSQIVISICWIAITLMILAYVLGYYTAYVR